MICPEGYFTPRMILAQFRGSLSNDRIFPEVLREGGVDAKNLAGGERKSILELWADVFLHHFCDLNRHSVRAYNPNCGTTVRLDDWIFDYADECAVSLPRCGSGAKALASRLSICRAYLDATDWMVLSSQELFQRDGGNSARGHRLKFITGWSICFRDSDAPRDIGSNLMGYAGQLARRNTNAPRKVGRPKKAEPLADAILEVFPDGLANKSAKEIGAKVLPTFGENFSEKTLRAAIGTAKAKMEATKT